MSPDFDLNRLLRRWHDSGYSSEVRDEVEALLDERFAPPPDHVCHWCTKTDTENEADGFGPLTDIYVLVANGEEGQGDVMRWACNAHLTEITDVLIGLGFGVHEHGGINFLEQRYCPGHGKMGACPTPEGDDE